MTVQREAVDLERTATLSDDGLYRYDLTRRWAPGPLALWIMLNPSTADASKDDPTLGFVTRHSQTLECGGLAIVNLYAFRSAEPDDLMSVDDPVGPDNVQHLTDWISRPSADVKYAIAAWGTKLPRHRPHPPVLLIAERYDRKLHCIERTKSGRPRHPLYTPKELKLEVFHPAVVAS